VNPRGGELFGEPVARSLSEVDGPVDVVDVFRPADEAPQIAREAVQVGASDPSSTQYLRYLTP
jgi:uncharacterized protein